MSLKAFCTAEHLKATHKNSSLTTIINPHEKDPKTGLK